MKTLKNTNVGETVKIKKNGVLYVKSIIKNVTNPKG